MDKAHKITFSGFNLDLSGKTHIMGVLNCTPDSFSDGGRYMEIDAALNRIHEMARDGADIIDIGGESTRPGAQKVTPEIEIKRTITLIKRASREIDIPISIDTCKSVVARAALDNGAAMINDVTGLKSDPLMARVAKEYDAPVVIMHMRGTPRSMQINPRYDSLIDDIIFELGESIDIARNSGVDENKIIIDPGIGFGKTVHDNLEIINKLDRFKVFKKPLLIGVSRKSFIAKILKEHEISDSRIEETGRLTGTIVASTISVIRGADILRVHDVKEISQAVKILDETLRS